MFVEELGVISKVVLVGKDPPKAAHPFEFLFEIKDDVNVCFCQTFEVYHVHEFGPPSIPFFVSFSPFVLILFQRDLAFVLLFNPDLWENNWLYAYQGEGVSNQFGL